MNRITRHASFPFVAPFVLFMLFLSLEGCHEAAVYIIYPIKTVAVFILLLYLLRRFPALGPGNPWKSAAVGIFVFLLWMVVGPMLAMSELKAVFKPMLFENKDIAWGLVIMRIFGASMVVPVMEELFWRGFLMRYLIREDFEQVPLGTYQHFSFWATTLVFAVAHGSLAPVAFLTGIIYGWWFVKTRSLGNIITAHAVTNLALGIYVVSTGKWFFW